ncbi:MAG: sugar ABC transporter ATP-binding protein [Candidatus Bipolaricaulota bacterium]
MPEGLLLEMRDIDKSFPGVQALDGVNFELEEGEVHALVGENGAGKTTLMNVLNGVNLPDAGIILFRGEERKITSPSRAQELGIAFVHQELNLIPPLSVTENILLGHEPRREYNPSLIDWTRAQEQARKTLARLELELPLTRPVEDLSVAEQQMVEIAKALYLESKILVLDEPTSSLTTEETERLFDVVRRLKKTGHSVVYISHRLEEVFEIGDRVTVLRNGKYVGTRSLEEISRDRVVEMMVGEEVDQRYIRREARERQVLLEVEGFATEGKVEEVNFELKKGEILGIAGLQGSGRTELLEGLYGARSVSGGRVRVEGNEVSLASPATAIEGGITYLPEDRQRKGLFLNQPLRSNIAAASLTQESRLGVINLKIQSRRVQQLVDQLGIVAPSIHQIINNLSGGNKQKTVLAKCLKTGASVILMNEPTRGIDVGAKVEVYQLMNELNEKSGVGIVMVSSELPELLQVSDRILVMFRGRVTASFSKAEASKEKLMRAMTGQAGG